MSFGAKLPAQATAREFFGSDYPKIEKQLQQLEAKFVNYSVLRLPQYLRTQTDSLATSRLMACVVFPEMLRYSRFSDYFETLSLQIGYINGGRNLVNFSIGTFQMRPSFAEDLELEIATRGLSHKFPQLQHTGSPRDQRQTRIEKLGQTDGQIAYLAAFVAVASQRFPPATQANSAALVEFYAAYYNLGLHATAAEIRVWAQREAFPMGSQFRGKQYRYAAISLDYYRQNP
jgi:hypothetical protein